MFNDLDAGFLFHLDPEAWEHDAPDIGGRIIAAQDGPQIEPGTRAGGRAYAAVRSRRRLHVIDQQIEWSVYVENLGAAIPMLGLIDGIGLGDPFLPSATPNAFARFVADFADPPKIGPRPIFMEYKEIGMPAVVRIPDPIVVLAPDTWHQFGILVQPDGLSFMHRETGGRGEAWNIHLEPAIDLSQVPLHALAAIRSDGIALAHLRVETRWRRLSDM